MKGEKMKSRIIIFLAVSFVCISCGFDMNPFSGWSPDMEIPPSGEIISVELNFKGKVTDKNDGSPILEVRIKLFSEESTNHCSVYTDKNVAG